MRVALFTLAAGLQSRSLLRLDPYDCYVDSGENYPGLADTTASGRKCQNWLEQKPHEHTFGSADTGLGNHGYCRNPGSREEKPWCYTLDSGKEWEFCNVPKCPPAEETPEAWEAPEGMKSDGEPTPCVPDEPAIQYAPFELTIAGTVPDQASCTSQKGESYWLIGSARSTQDDEEACMKSCLTTAGANYAVHWGSDLEDGTNCGCFRECIPTEDANDGAINMPAAFRLRPPSLLQIQGSCHKGWHHSTKAGKKGTLLKKEAPKDLWREAKDRANAVIQAKKHK